ncbi:bric-a-brac protein [Wolffia australiana]
MWGFPATKKQLAATGLWFSVGLILFGIGAHLSYVNVAPQQARTKARSDFVKEYLRKKYGYEGGRK